MRFRYLTRKDRLTFPMRTGLSPVPTTAILDTDSRIKLVHSGMLTETEISIFVEKANQVGRLKKLIASRK